MRGLIFFFGLCSVLTISTVTAEKKVVCYFGSWSVYRPGNGKFDISDIDPWQCTHLIYTFVGLSGNNVKVLDAWQDLADDWGKNGFGRFNALREKNPALKTIIAIGGWNEGSTKYSEMAKTPEGREEFADNVVKFVNKYKFDGFDLDWEYPAQRGGAPEDLDNYIELLKVLRKHFDENKLILTAAVAAAKSSASKSYKISQMCKYLDLVNIMAYDLHGAWESQTGMNAPLIAVAGDNAELSVEATANYWLNQKCPKEKVILGVPSYGRTFTLVNANSNQVGAPTRGPGQAGHYTREAGMLGYNEICELLKDDSWKSFYDKGRRVPYAYNGVQWVGYDNVASIKEKAELIKKLDLGGAMVWSIETDDFKGNCGEKYPILKTLNAVLRDGKTVPPMEKLPLTPSEKPPSTLKPEINEPATDEPSTDEPSPTEDTETPELPYKCKQEGNFPKPGSCNFISCVNNHGGGFTAYEFKCGPGLCFNPNLHICDWKYSHL